jgi:hypothetical protein
MHRLKHISNQLFEPFIWQLDRTAWRFEDPLFFGIFYL